MANRNPFSLYVHIPYCLKKCPYCDFNSYASADLSSSEPQYTKALLNELSHYGTSLAWGDRQIATIFFGGGTPSMFSPESIEQILSKAAETFGLAPNSEVTLEANPGTVAEDLGKDKLSSFRSVGINRISLGGQSFNAAKLQKLGRIHSSNDTAAAIDNIRQAGFENFNVDMMFGVVGETVESWAEDLAQAVSFHPPHLSAYGLTIEPGTEFGRLAKRGVKLQPGEQIQAELYKHTQRYLADSGYAQYEISNYATPGRECRHNLQYWNGGDFLGLGAGAHSGLSILQNGDCTKAPTIYGQRWSNIPKPEHYIERALVQGDASQRREELSQEQAELEFFLLGLRTTTGISLDDYQKLFGQSLLERYQVAFKQLDSEGLIAFESETITLTTKGFLFADYVFSTIAGS